MAVFHITVEEDEVATSFFPSDTHAKPRVQTVSCLGIPDSDSALVDSARRNFRVVGRVAHRIHPRVSGLDWTQKSFAVLSIPHSQHPV